MELTGIAGAAGGLFMTIMRIVLILIVAAGGFFGTRAFAKHKKHMNNFKIKAHISNPDGSHILCKIGKFKYLTFPLIFK